MPVRSLAVADGDINTNSPKPPTVAAGSVVLSTASEVCAAFLISNPDIGTTVTLS